MSSVHRVASECIFKLQITDMLYVTEIAEKIQSTLLLMFIFYVTLIRIHVEIQLQRNHLIL